MYVGKQVTRGCLRRTSELIWVSPMIPFIQKFREPFL
jgi:hypothetical protein